MRCPVQRGSTRRLLLQWLARLWCSAAIWATYDGRRGREVFANDRALKLDSLSGDFIAEVALRGLPFNLLDRGAMESLVAASDAFLLAFGTDRGSSNFTACRFLWDVIEHTLPRSVLPWVEPCAAHGVAITKTHARASRQVAAGIISFTRWTRASRTLDTLYDEVARQVSTNLVVPRTPRPQEESLRAAALLTGLYGGDEYDALWAPSGARRGESKASVGLVKALRGLQL